MARRKALHQGRRQTISRRNQHSCRKVSSHFRATLSGLVLTHPSLVYSSSVVTLDKCVRNFSRFTGCSLGEAIKCATYNPAKFVLALNLCITCINLPSRCLGIEDKKGTLRAGAHADFVVLDRNGIVLSTWVRGKEVWTRKV